MGNQQQGSPNVTPPLPNFSPSPFRDNIFGNEPKKFKASEIPISTSQKEPFPMLASPIGESRPSLDIFKPNSQRFSQTFKPQDEEPSANRSNRDFKPDGPHISSQQNIKSLFGSGLQNSPSYLLSKKSIRVHDHDEATKIAFYQDAIDKGKAMKIMAVPIQISEHDINTEISRRSIFKVSNPIHFLGNEKSSRIYLKEIPETSGSDLLQVESNPIPVTKMPNNIVSPQPLNGSLQLISKTNIEPSLLRPKNGPTQIDYSKQSANTQKYIPIENLQKNEIFHSAIKNERFKPRQAISLQKFDSQINGSAINVGKKITFGQNGCDVIIAKSELQSSGTIPIKTSKRIFENDLKFSETDRFERQYSQFNDLKESQVQLSVKPVERKIQQINGSDKSIFDQQLNQPNEQLLSAIPINDFINQKNTNEIYEGETRLGFKHGKGKLVKPNQLTYIGDFINDKFHGQGTIFYKDGKRFVGEFKNNQKEGHGKLFDQKGNLEKEGLWVNDQSI